MFVFSKFLLFTFFWANLVPKPEVLQINRNLVQGYTAIWLLRFWCLFFQNLYHSCFFDQIWSHNLDFLKLIEISSRVTFLFFQDSFHLYFLGKFGPKIRCSSNWLKFGTEVDHYMLISILMFIFSKFLSFIFFGQIWSQNLKFSK